MLCQESDHRRQQRDHALIVIILHEDATILPRLNKNRYYHNRSCYSRVCSIDRRHRYYTRQRARNHRNHFNVDRKKQRSRQRSRQQDVPFPSALVRQREPNCFNPAWPVTGGYRKKINGGHQLAMNNESLLTWPHEPWIPNHYVLEDFGHLVHCAAFVRTKNLARCTVKWKGQDRLFQWSSKKDQRDLLHLAIYNTTGLHASREFPHKVWLFAMSLLACEAIPPPSATTQELIVAQAPPFLLASLKIREIIAGTMEFRDALVTGPTPTFLAALMVHLYTTSEWIKLTNWDELATIARQVGDCGQ